VDIRSAGIALNNLCESIVYWHCFRSPYQIPPSFRHLRILIEQYRIKKDITTLAKPFKEVIHISWFSLKSPDKISYLFHRACSWASFYIFAVLVSILVSFWVARTLKFFNMLDDKPSSKCLATNLHKATIVAAVNILFLFYIKFVAYFCMRIQSTKLRPNSNVARHVFAARDCNLIMRKRIALQIRQYSCSAAFIQKVKQYGLPRM